MTIREVLDKVLADGIEKLTDDERAMLSNFKDVDVEKMANDRAAKARLDGDKRLKEVEAMRVKAEEQLAALQEQLETATGKEKTEVEKLMNRVDKLTKELDVERGERTRAAAENVKLTRNHKLDSIFQKFVNGETQKLAPGVDAGDLREVLGLRLGEIDLNDEELVSQHLDKFRDRNKALFVAPNAGGTGSGNGGEGGGGSGSGSGGGRQSRGAVDSAALLDAAQHGTLADAEAAVKEANERVRAGAKVV